MDAYLRFDQNLRWNLEWATNLGTIDAGWSHFDVSEVIQFCRSQNQILHYFYL